jgi:hypothetical protein
MVDEARALQENGNVGRPDGATPDGRPSPHRRCFTGAVTYSFHGEICGFGTASGVRIVLGCWASSPFGTFADAMIEHPSGRRTLVAPRADVARFITGIYAFDETIVAEVRAVRSPHRLHVSGGPLSADVTIGNRSLAGWALRCVPRALAASVTWAALIDPVARVVMHGVRTSGRTPGGRETYGATDHHSLRAANARWHGVALGELRDLDPPVRFGFSSAPRRPSIVAVTTTVRPR